jgi:predicted alpha/beta-fold hydrolase
MNPDILYKVINTTYVSEYDRTVYPLLGYKTEEECYEHYSAFDIDKLRIPIVAIQPIDDFIQGNDIRGNIPLDKYTASPTVLYMETSHGNHLGFYEGGVLEAFSNDTSYTYPPRVAIAVHNAIRKLKDASLLPPQPTTVFI